MKLPDQEKDQEDFLNFDDYPEFIFTEEDTQLKEDLQENQEQENKDTQKTQNKQSLLIIENNQQKEEQQQQQQQQQAENNNTINNDENIENSDSEEDYDNEDEDSFEEIDVKLQNQNQFQTPKHLYDCYLGLKSDNRQRIELSLKHLNYLIRKDLDDLSVMWEDLATLLLSLHSIDQWMYHFDSYRTRALVSLSILKPQEMSKVLMLRFYAGECSLGDRHFVLGILKDATIELADNPKKYVTENFNEYTSTESNGFYFKKLETKYLNKDQEMKIQKENQNKIERQQILNQKSKRWGQTRLNFEQQVGEDLKKIQKQDLNIIKPKKQEVFINRFNSLIECFFFPLLIPLRTKHFQKFKQYKLLITQITQIITVYIENGQNSHLFYKLIEEALEFLLQFRYETDVNFTRAKLQLLMKITVLSKKELLLQYPLVIRKLVEMCKELASQKISSSEDQNNKILMTMIINNIQELFNFGGMFSSIQM